MKMQWQYKPTKISSQLAAFVPVIIRNPLRDKKIEVECLVDTGYDGFVLISTIDFLKLGLDEFEFPDQYKAKAELYSGEEINLRSSRAEVIIKDGEISRVDEIDAVEETSEPLIGRKFLEVFYTILDGPKKTILLSLGENDG